MASTQYDIGLLRSALSDRYRIESEIGAGGMATVFLAQDLKHDRKVAVKVLKPELAAVLGAERFLSEIKTTANLQHPHILALFDSGEADGFLFYVMPFVAGESLRVKVDREKQLPVNEAVGITKSVAAALDYAHRQGVIHRDIKPANILLHDGQPMVADFGIALAVRAAGGARITETGLSLGTPQYMSPEQASGDREVDGRSDIYSLGAVLYEMLAGEPPHVGPTVQSIIAKLLTDKPRPVGELRETVPGQVAAAVERALAKLPADRFVTAEAFGNSLSGRGAPFSAPRGGVPPEGTVRTNRLFRVLPWALVLGLLVLLMAWGSRDKSGGRESQVTFVNITLPDTAPLAFIGESFGGIGQPAFAFAPDGRNLVFVGQVDSTVRLYVRSLDGFGVRELPNTEGALSPFFSPDGEWIGFFANHLLHRIALGGEGAVPVTAAYEPYGGSWDDQDRIVSVTRDARELLITNPAGDDPQRPPMNRAFSRPQWLPDSDWLLANCYVQRELCVVSAETGEVRSLMTSGEAGDVDGVPLEGTNPLYVDGGYIVFSDPTENVVFGVRFDPHGLVTLSEPAELFRGVRREGSQGNVQLSISASGDLVYAPGVNAIRGRFVWVGPDQVRDTLPFSAQVYGAFYLSPDGRRLNALVTSEVGQQELRFFDLERDLERRWTPDDPVAISAVQPGPWLPDSDSALIALSRGDTSDLVIVDPDRTVGGRTVWTGRGSVTAQNISPDGMVLFVVYSNERRYLSQAPLDGLSTLPPDVDEAFPPLADESGNEAFPGYSSDGKWLLYNSDFEGPWELYAQRSGSEEPPEKLSRNGGDIGRWTPLGEALFFRNGQSFYRIERADESENPFSEPEFFVEGDFLNVPGAELAVHPDGERLLLLEGPGQRTTTELRLVQNWKRLLEERLGGG